MQYVIRHCLSRPEEIDPVESTQAVSRCWTMLFGAAGLGSIRRLVHEAARVAEERGLEVQKAKLRIYSENDPSELDCHIDVLRESGDPEALMMGLRQKGLMLQYHSERPDKSLIVYEEALQLDHARISKPVMISFYMAYADVLMDSHQTIKSKQILENALAMAEEGSYTQLTGEVARLLAHLERVRGVYYKSSRYIQLAINTCIQPDLVLAAMLGSSGRTMLMQNRFEEAEQAFFLAYRIFHGLELDGDWGATIQGHLVDLYLAQDRTAEAAAIVEARARAIRKSPTNIPQVWLVYHVATGNLVKGQQTLNQLLDARSKLRATGNRSYAVLAADLYLQLGRFDDALREVITLLISACQAGHRVCASMMLLRLGDVLRIGPDYADIDSASSCYAVSLALVEFLGVPRHRADALVRVSASRALKGDLANALSDFVRARRLFERSCCSLGGQVCGGYIEALKQRCSQEDKLKTIESELPDYFAPNAFPPPTLLGYVDFL
jgi:tetratricopeptide (TPR) repeat protein